MFGDNPIRSAEADPNQLFVQSHFYTIQGEGPQSGRPCVFVRLAGCNLACWFCDTEFESGMSAPRVTEQLVEELNLRYSQKQRELVVLTGGEPLRQNILLFLAMLFSSGTRLVQIETAGTLWVEGLHRYISNGLVQLVCSPKTPRLHPSIVAYCEHWKYIVRAGDEDRVDGLPARGTGLATRDKVHLLFRPRFVRDPSYSSDFGTIWVSPMDEYDAERNKANLRAVRDAALQHGYRVSLQTHKILDVE